MALKNVCYLLYVSAFYLCSYVAHKNNIIPHERFWIIIFKMRFLYVLSVINSLITFSNSISSILLFISVLNLLTCTWVLTLFLSIPDFLNWSLCMSHSYSRVYKLKYMSEQYLNPKHWTTVKIFPLARRQYNSLKLGTADATVNQAYWSHMVLMVHIWSSALLSRINYPNLRFVTRRNIIYV